MVKNYSSLQKDDNHEAIQAGSGILTVDSSDTQKESPLSYSSTILTISVPENAAEFVVKPSSDLRVSEQSDMSTYYVVSASTTHAFGVSRTDSLYIVRDSADGTVNFYFVTV